MRSQNQLLKDNISLVICPSVHFSTRNSATFIRRIFKQFLTWATWCSLSARYDYVRSRTKVEETLREGLHTFIWLIFIMQTNCVVCGVQTAPEDRVHLKENPSNMIDSARVSRVWRNLTVQTHTQKWQFRRIIPNLFPENAARNIPIKILSCSITINLMVYPTTHSFQINVGLTLTNNVRRVSAETFGKKSITAAILHNWPIKHEIH